jgi:hypothetical protein
MLAVPQQRFSAVQVAEQLAGVQQAICQQTLPLPHEVPSAVLVWAQWPVASQTSSVQGLPSLVQAVLGESATCVQPVVVLQPSVVQGSLSLQLRAGPGAQTPFMHLSAWVQALPSVQSMPLFAAGVEHLPVVGLHAPARWQASMAVQVTGPVRPHLPAWQVSVPLH